MSLLFIIYKKGINVKAQEKKDDIGESSQTPTPSPKAKQKQKKQQLGFFTNHLILSCAFHSGPSFSFTPIHLPFISLNLPSLLLHLHRSNTTKTLIPLSLSLIHTFHQTPSPHGQSGQANQAQVRHQTLALLLEAQSHRQLRLRRLRRRSLRRRSVSSSQGRSTLRRLRREVEAAVSGEIGRGGAPSVSGARGQVGAGGGGRRGGSGV